MLDAKEHHKGCPIVMASHQTYSTGPNTFNNSAASMLDSFELSRKSSIDLKNNSKKSRKPTYQCNTTQVNSTYKSYNLTKSQFAKISQKQKYEDLFNFVVGREQAPI